MRKIFQLIMVLLLSMTLSAQKQKTLSLKVGNYFDDWYVTSFYAANFRIDYADTKKESSLKRMALFIIDAETQIQGIVHLGGGLSYQYSSLFVPHHKLPPGFASNSEELTIRLHRINIALKPTFHYVRWLRLDLYSGMRMGYEFLHFTDNSQDSAFELKEKEFIVINFVPQLILLGLNVELFKGFAANLECAYGEPGYVAAGLTYRISGRP